MDPQIWGKHLWASIHFIALGYPDSPSDSESKSYEAFFKSLYKVLPCKSCSNHLRETLAKQHPLTPKDLVDKDALFKWTVDLHNVVNTRLKKPVMSLDQATMTYMKRDRFSNAMCPTTDHENEMSAASLLGCSVLSVLLIALLVLLLYVYYGRRIRFRK
jgi:FAD-linked sulfhydryl oxidase